MQKKKISRCVNIKIPAFHTYLIEEYIDITEQMKISLLSGCAEIFGLQLKINYPHYYVVPCSIPVFSWQGAQVSIQWIQYEGIKNSQALWIDLTSKLQIQNNVHYSHEQNSMHITPMVDYLELSYNLIQKRKIAFQSNKYGPIVAIVGEQSSAPQNVSRLLLNYSGKFSMNPIFVDLDPESSLIFIDGSIGALEFEYKIIEDLYDRPDKICFYYGNRTPKEQSFMALLTVLKQNIKKKLGKQKKQFMEHGCSEEYPFFVSGMIIHCPKIRFRNNAKDQYELINKIVRLFQVTHIVSVDCQAYLDQVPGDIKAQKIKTRTLQGTQSFLDLPRPLKSKIERYFGGDSKKKTFPISEISIYEFMSKNNEDQMHCRKIEIRQEAISKNTVAILHAKIEEGQELDPYKLAQRALYSPICYLIHIFSIDQDQITFDAPAQSIFEEYKNNIWVTSSTDQ